MDRFYLPNTKTEILLLEQTVNLKKGPWNRRLLWVAVVNRECKLLTEDELQELFRLEDVAKLGVASMEGFRQGATRH